MQTTTRPNAFHATTEDVPAMIAALLHEITTLRAEVRALTEIARGRVSKSKFDSFSLAITNKAFEETQEQMNNFGIRIQLVPEKPCQALNGSGSLREWMPYTVRSRSVNGSNAEASHAGRPH